MGPPDVDVDVATGPAATGRGPARRLRSDAQRNVAALVEAAKSVFATTGVDAPAKEITDRAGVGVGTLYRHFPRRSDLVVAVMRHEVEACAEAATTLAAEREPWDALTAWIERFTELVATKRGLATALHSGDPAFDGLPASIMGALEPSLAGLLDAAARADGHANAQVTARDVLLTVALLCQRAPGEDGQFGDRMIRIFVAGLRRP
jgi:AcrR family transcriptional regulator